MGGGVAAVDYGVAEGFIRGVDRDFCTETVFFTLKS